MMKSLVLMFAMFVASPAFSAEGLYNCDGLQLTETIVLDESDVHWQGMPTIENCPITVSLTALKRLGEPDGVRQIYHLARTKTINEVRRCFYVGSRASSTMSGGLGNVTLSCASAL